MNDRERLIAWLSLFSLKKGEQFTLASGEVSDVYVDVKKTALKGNVHTIIAELLFDKMMSEFAPVEAVAGVALGGCHLSSIVAMHGAIKHNLWLDVIHVRKTPKSHGTQQLLEKPNMHEYQEVVLLEDVVTTGNSSCVAAKAIQDEGYTVKGILSVVDRRIKKEPYLGGTFMNWKFASLVNFEELQY